MTYKMELCAGRHETGCDKSVFPATVDPADFDGMDEMAGAALANLEPGDQLALYVTGLTAATAAVIKYCVLYRIGLLLYHFDRETNSYHAQRVVWAEQCPMCGDYFVHTRGIFCCPRCGSQ